MRASKDSPTLLELSDFFQKKRALLSTREEYFEDEEVSNPERTQPSSRKRTATATTIGQAVNRRRAGRLELAMAQKRATNSSSESESQASVITPVSRSGLIFPEFSEVPSPCGSRVGDSCFQKAAGNVARDGKDKRLNLQSLENRSKKVMPMAPHQPQKKAPDVVHDHEEGKEISGQLGVTHTNQPLRRKMRGANNTVKLPPIQQPVKETATPSYKVKPEEHSEYSKDEETQLSATAASTTTGQEAYRPRRGRLALVMAQKRTSNNSYTSEPRVSVTPVSKSGFSLAALAEAPPLRSEVNDGSRSGAYYFQTAATNVGRDGNKNYTYHQSPRIRSRRNNTLASWHQPQLNAPDNVYDPNGGEGNNKMVAIDGPSGATKTDQAHQRAMLSDGNTVEPRPIMQQALQPPIPSRLFRPEERRDAIQSFTRCRRFGRQEVCKEPAHERGRRQGVCMNSESARAERTFLRVLNKRF